MMLMKIRPNMYKLIARDYNVVFSYETPIAYWTDNNNHMFVSTNEWTKTTGKHISELLQNENSQQIKHAEWVERFLLDVGELPYE